jgi:phage-related protein
MRFLPIGARLLGITGNLLKLFKAIPIIGQVVAVVMGVIDGIKGFFNAKEILGLDKVSIIDRLASFVASVLSGLTFGLLSPKTFGKILKPIRIFWNYVFDFFVGIFTKPKEMISKVFNDIKKVFVGVMEFFSGGGASNVFKKIVSSVKIAIGWIGDVFKMVGSKVSEVFGSVVDSIKKAWDWLVEKFSNVFNLEKIKTTIPSFDVIFDTLTSFFSRLAGWIGGIPMMILGKVPDFMKNKLASIIGTDEKPPQVKESIVEQPTATGDYNIIKSNLNEDPFG